MNRVFVYSENGELLHKGTDHGDHMIYHRPGTTIRIREYRDCGDHYDVVEWRIRKLKGGSMGAVSMEGREKYIFIVAKSELLELEPQEIHA